MIYLRIVTVLLLSVAQANFAQAQFKSQQETAGPRLGDKRTVKYQAGVAIQAAGGACKALRATVPIPQDWPGQQVRIVDENTSVHVRRVTTRTIDDGVKQILIEIPLLAAGEEAHAVFTFEVERSRILPPAEPELLTIPKRIPRDLRTYLGPSPYIESRDRRIRSLAKEILAAREYANDWQRVEAIYDTVREKVEYKEGELKGAVAALRDGYGDCEELTSLFIALCRASDIPARTVWVPDHCYPEFYLTDAKGEGYWIPCQAAGTRAFGEMPDHRPVLQKGDNFKVPQKRTPQRYVAEFLRGLPVPGGGRPRVKWIHEVVD